MPQPFFYTNQIPFVPAVPNFKTLALFSQNIILIYWFQYTTHTVYNDYIIFCPIFRYKEEVILAGILLVGIFLYQILKKCGLVPVIGLYEGPLGG